MRISCEYQICVGEIANKKPTTILVLGPPNFFAKMIEMANLIRQAFSEEQLEFPYSPRNLIEWAETYIKTGDVALAFKYTYNYTTEAESVQHTIKNFWRDVDFGVSL